MAQPAHLVVVPSHNATPVTAERWGAFVPTPTSELEASDRTHIARAALPAWANWLIRGCVLAIAIAAPVVAFAGEREVTLDADGRKTRVRTYAATGEELLERKGIEVARSDLVTPVGDLSEQGLVKFRRATEIRLALDGKKSTVVARGLTVGEALKDLGLVPGDDDHVHPPADTQLRPGLEVFVRNAIRSKLRLDGQVRDVVSSADTVGTLLEHAGVRTDSDDYVFPSPGTVPKDGMWIRVVRVRTITEQKTVSVPFRYVTQNDSSLESGQRRVAQQGSEGLKVQRFSVRLEDGIRVSSRMLGETVTRQARDHIVRVGTKGPQYTGGSTTPSTGIASWFGAEGMVAAHRTLPIGSVVKVTSLENGKSVTVKINQRGPFVEGRIIDLSDDAFARLAPLGKGTVKVRVDS